MKRIKIGLLPKILIAIVLGIGLGLGLVYMTDTLNNETADAISLNIVRFFTTINAIFSQFLGFAIPLIILGLVTAAIADIGNKAGKMLVVTVLIAYLSTVFAGLVSYFTGVAVFPSLIDTGAEPNVAEFSTIEPFFTMTIPPLMPVMTALILAFTLGLGIASTQNKSLLSGAHGFEEIVVKMIKKAIIPLLPLYIFTIFLSISYNGEVFNVLKVFIKIIGIIFLIHIGILILQFTIAGIVTKKNPFRLLWNMMPAYFTALGTQSSAATIPVTLERAILNGTSAQVAGFTVPLCATIHMSGSMLKIVACALALMMMNSIPFDFGMFAGFTCMLAITMVAAPGVPGGAIMASLGLLSSMLGFTETDLGLMTALYIAMDSFGTACNVTGDGAIALIIDKIFGKKTQN